MNFSSRSRSVDEIWPIQSLSWLIFLFKFAASKSECRATHRCSVTQVIVRSFQFCFRYRLICAHRTHRSIVFSLIAVCVWFGWLLFLCLFEFSLELANYRFNFLFAKQGDRWFNSIILALDAFPTERNSVWKSCLHNWYLNRTKHRQEIVCFSSSQLKSTIIRFIFLRR